MLVVGAFHVVGGLGTITKYLERRPGDKVALLVMEHGEAPDFPFAEEDRGEGDAVLKVRPPEKAPPAVKSPHAAPPKAAPGGPDAPPPAPQP